MYIVDGISEVIIEEEEWLGIKLVDSGLVINVELGIELWEEYKEEVFLISVEDKWEVDKKVVIIVVLISEDFIKVE